MRAEHSRLASVRVHYHSKFCHLRQTNLSRAVFQNSHVNVIFGLRNANSLAKEPQGSGGVAPAADSAESWHSGVVPAADVSLVHQLDKLAFAEHRVLQIESGEFDLGGSFICGAGQETTLQELVDHPIVERPMVGELEGAERVRYLLNGITDGVGEIVHGIDAPLVARHGVRGSLNAIESRVPQVQVRTTHIDLRAKDAVPIREASLLHRHEETKVLLNRPLSEGGVDSRLGEGPSHLSHCIYAHSRKSLKLRIGKLMAAPAEESST